MRVLVTGGAGFIGSAVARLAIGEGDDVLVIDKLTYAGNLSTLKSISNSPRFKMINADIGDDIVMTGAIRSFEPDVVMHLAAESHVDRSINSAGVFVETNIVGTYKLLEVVRDYWAGLSGSRKSSFRFLHVSTDEVFGSLGEKGSFREDTRYDPRSPYSASKAASDHLARAWYHTYGLPVLISNCSNNYGPYQLPEKLIPLIIINGIAGSALPVYGDGGNVRDWLYVEDHARALRAIVEKGKVGETYNIGGGNERTNLQVVHSICDELDRQDPIDTSRRTLINFVEDRPGHDRRYAIDASKLNAETGWLARESFQSGIEQTIRWYFDNEWWWAPLRSRGHGVSRLGLIAEMDR